MPRIDAEIEPEFGPLVSGDACVALGRRSCELQRQRGASPAANQDAGSIIAVILSEDRARLARRSRSAWWLAAAVLTLTSCGAKPDTGDGPNVATLGTAEVTARLVEIRGDFPDLPNYDYAFVMRYEVTELHRGEFPSKTIHVGHYNPLKPRAEAADARVEQVGGNLGQFNPGDFQRMALEVPIDDFYMGGIVNRYFDEGVEPIYWAVWTNRVVE